MKNISPQKSGQAIVEFMAGIVVVLVLVAGLIQVAILTKKHTDTMNDARIIAGKIAMLPLDPDTTIISNPDYLKDWEAGLDLKKMSRDDEKINANPSSFQQLVVDKSVANNSDWSAVIDQVPNNRISGLHNDPLVINSLGLVRGHDSEIVNLNHIPAFKHLIYNADSIDVESEVWMPLLKGIY